MVIISQRSNLDPIIYDQMLRIRAVQFSARRGWHVSVSNGKEEDVFDTESTTYVCVVVGDKLIASLRLIPTDQPYMLEMVFPELLHGSAPLKNPAIFESSRFCVNTKVATRRYRDGVNVVTRELLAGLFTFAVEQRMEAVISVFDTKVGKILKRAGCRFEAFGPAIPYDDRLMTVAARFEVSQDVVDRLLDHRHSPFNVKML